MFFTDGVSSEGHEAPAESTLEELKSYLASRKKTLRSRFISIGFRQAHDEEMMMKIFKAGTVRGYYGFVDDTV